MKLWGRRGSNWAQRIKALRCLLSKFSAQIFISIRHYTTRNLPTCISCMGTCKEKKRRLKGCTQTDSRVGICRHFPQELCVSEYFMFRSWIRVIEDIVKFLLWNKLYCAQQMIILQKAWELLGASNSFSFPVHERHVGKICFGITMYVFRNISEEWRFKSEKNFQP